MPTSAKTTQPGIHAVTRAAALAVVAALTLAPAPSAAIAPALLLMLKQMAKQTASSMIKDTLLSNLRGMGCKGSALADALTALDLRGGGAPKLPSGMAMPNLPAMPGMPAMPGIAGTGLMPGGMPGGMPPGMSAEMHARMQSLMQPGVAALPPGAGISPDMMARVQQAMGQPLSVPETLATVDELFELGFMPKAIQAEFKECLVLVPATAAPMGMAMGMFKPMIPQLRQAREQMHALSPAEQDEAVAALVQEIGPLPAAQRAEFIEHLGSGFFPKRMADSIKAQLLAR